MTCAVEMTPATCLQQAAAAAACRLPAGWTNICCYPEPCSTWSMVQGLLTAEYSLQVSGMQSRRPPACSTRPRSHRCLLHQHQPGLLRWPHCTHHSCVGHRVLLALQLPQGGSPPHPSTGPTRPTPASALLCQEGCGQMAPPLSPQHAAQVGGSQLLKTQPCSPGGCFSTLGCIPLSRQHGSSKSPWP